MNRIKDAIKKVIPFSVVERYHRFKRHKREEKNRTKGLEEVFTEIYEKKMWGNSKEKFCSGSGSTDKEIVSAYVSMVTKKASSEGFLGLTFVDLGCGDFRVGEQLISLSSTYIGVDVVKQLIIRNKHRYGNQKVRFMHLDIVDDDLPDGDVCFVRQVLQHLSNQQIKVILPKLKKYKWIFITEHYPTDNSTIKPNIDKVHGSGIRIYMNSGVYLSEAPFELPAKKLSQVLEVPGSGNEQGIIRTFLYKP